MSLSKDFVSSCLTGVADPVRGKDLVSSGALQWVSACDTYASIRLQMPGGTGRGVLDQVAQLAHAKLSQVAERNGTRVDSFIVEFVDEAGTVVHKNRFGGMASGAGGASEPRVSASGPAAASAPGSAGHTPIPGLQPTNRPTGAGLPGVKNIIAVGAGKGGVGKSSIALNLAVGLARKGHAVGLLDGDIYGPSMPTMLGLAPLEQAVLNGRLQPFYIHGIKAITIGKLVDADRPLIWRGPMAHGAFKQLTEQTQWGELDYLIIDLPPGTGDIALTMAQSLALTGAVVVCTPQKVALDDAIRAARMFQQLNIEVLGVVENMSSFVGDDGKVYDIFGKGGAEVMAQRLGVPFLGSVPITMSLRANSDGGDPTANFTGTDAAGMRLRSSLDTLVQNLESQVALGAMRSGREKPVLTIS
ncbi:MAG TPA: Mrp/NBP35 family ATP-binding protein [Phycisphaerales bacterium]